MIKHFLIFSAFIFNILILSLFYGYLKNYMHVPVVYILFCENKYLVIRKVVANLLLNVVIML